jgi:hypothetical protein
LANFNWGAYDLVVIDESHNFRNNTKGKRDETGQLVRLSRYERLMQDIICSGVRTKVLLLSAMPVNNTLTDLRNQISIIAGSDVVRDEQANTAFRDTVGIDDLKEALRQAQTHFAAWARQKPEARTVSTLLERLGSDFFKLLDALTISRSRRHIERYYKDSLKELGGFPTRTKPVSIYPELDTKNLFMNYDRLNDEISRYRLSLFNPSQFVKPEYRQEYDNKVGNFTQAQRERFLIGMMKVWFLKRLRAGEGANGPRLYDWALQPLVGPVNPGGAAGCWCAAASASPQSWPTTWCLGRSLPPCARWCGPPAAGGPLQRAWRRPKERLAWTTMRYIAGQAGIVISPWRCWRMRISS